MPTRSGSTSLIDARSSYREKGQVKHTTHGRLTGMSLSALKLIQAAFRGDVIPKGSTDGFRATESKEYGARRAVLGPAKELGLDRALYSRREEWVEDGLAMIAGRVVYAGSKLALSQQWKNSALWELSGAEGFVDVDRHCYAAMDRLPARPKAIERTLAQRHLKQGHLDPFRGGSRDDDAGERREGSRHRGTQHDLRADASADHGVAGNPAVVIIVKSIS